MKTILLVVSYSLALSASTSAAIIFESGTLGSTGITWNDLENQTVPGTNVNSSVFIGVRFELNQPVVVSQIGGHFVAPGSSTFFGAIVKLTNPNDFPDSTNLSTADVLGVAKLSFPSPSAEVFGNLNLSLEPAWYALIFGSGLFGTNGYGGTVENGSDIGTPTYISWTGNGDWSNTTNPIFRNYRLVVQGAFVPEPSSILTAALSLLIFIGRRRTFSN